MEFEGRRFKDQFLWDKNEPFWDLDEIARILVEEHSLPTAFENEIVS